MEGSNEEVKSTEATKTVKEEKKEEKEKEKEVKEKKRNSQHVEPSPKATTKAARSSYPTRKLEKVNKEPLNKERILDPLDLLEPVYEEVTKESVPPKLKEVKSVPVKKGKLKKRKISEEREESPPPLFLSRKGTRSRPNVKIPKYYHTHYERVSDAAIVREPHTDQAADPLMQVEEIKAEPLDLDDDVIEIEDNVIEFPDITPHDEEIIGNYDSPLVNLDDGANKPADHDAFKNVSLVAQPIIMDIHSIAEKPSSSLEIIDLGQLKEGTAESSDKVDDPLATISYIGSDKAGEDPLNFDTTSVDRGTAGITITNVQSIVDLEEEEKREEVEAESGGFRIEKIVSEKEVAQPEVAVGKESRESEDTVIVLDDAAGGSEAENIEDKAIVTEEVSCVEHPKDNTLEKGGETEAETKTQDPNNSENQVEVISLVEPENPVEAGKAEASQEPENTVEAAAAEAPQTEENGTVLGFHIAKVASEQFSASETVDSAVISENCASELGFQITNVVSGQFEDADVHMTGEGEVSDLGAFSNHLSEAEGEINESGIGPAESNATQSERSATISDETRFLAESLEKLLDE